MIAARYDVTDVVAARRLTRPRTWLFVTGLAVGWVADVLLVVVVAHLGVGWLISVATAVVGYLLLPVSVVTVLRVGWLRTHGTRRIELDRQLGEHVPALRSWVDRRLGTSVDLPPDLATIWLLCPEPESTRELLPLDLDAGWRIGGAAVAARHEVVDDRVLLRLAVLPSATMLADGPEPPLTR